jgi:hypothetical protein
LRRQGTEGTVSPGTTIVDGSSSGTHILVPAFWPADPFAARRDDRGLGGNLRAGGRAASLPVAIGRRGIAVAVPPHRGKRGALRSCSLTTTGSTPHVQEHPHSHRRFGGVAQGHQGRHQARAVAGGERSPATTACRPCCPLSSATATSSTRPWSTSSTGWRGPPARSTSRRSPRPLYRRRCRLFRPGHQATVDARGNHRRREEEAV